MIEVSINDDYAVLTTTNYGFYYGYEYDFEEDKYGDTHEIWGFEVNGNDGKIFRISADEMKLIKNCPDKWDCEKMLLFGIGLFFNKLPEDLDKKENIIKEVRDKIKEFCWDYEYETYSNMTSNEVKELVEILDKEVN